MAESFAGRVFFTRRVVVIAAVVLAGGAVAGVAAAAGGGGSAASSSGGGGRVATAAVVRTNLTSTVQVGGSIGYGGSYTVAAPSGTSASALAQAQQAVAQDQQALSADEQAESDAAAAGSQAVTADEANVSTGQSALSADRSALSADQSALSAEQAKKTRDCAGTGVSSAACSQDAQQVSQDAQQVSQDQQKVSQDKAALTQAGQQLAAAQSAAKTSHDQAQAKVQADQTRLKGDQAALASDRASAVSPGTAYTWLPKAGQVIRQDQPVYKVSNEPVPLLYGSVPAYRAFYVGMSDGGDVGELTHDLIALGYGGGLAQSNRYSPATAAAVERWQKALGLPATGEILLGEVVFEPGPIRVTSVTPPAGAPAGGGSGGGGGGGTVLTATGITPVVTVDLGVDQEYLVKPGDAVSVVLPDGTSTVGGRIKTVGKVATCPGGGGTGTGGTGTGGSAGGGGGSAGQSPCSSAGSNGGGGSNSSPAVPVTITLDRTPPGAALDQAPVNVSITTQRARNVLAVPVNALLALAGGGYGVDVVTGRTSHLAGVTTGMYSSTLVQVSGPGIRAGMRVEVPSS